MQYICNLICIISIFNRGHGRYEKLMVLLYLIKRERAGGAILGSSAYKSWWCYSTSSTTGSVAPAKTLIRLALGAKKILKNHFLYKNIGMQSLLDKLETTLEKFLKSEICRGKILIFCRNIHPWFKCIMKSTFIL